MKKIPNTVDHCSEAFPHQCSEQGRTPGPETVLCREQRTFCCIDPVQCKSVDQWERGLSRLNANQFGLEAGSEISTKIKWKVKKPEGKKMVFNVGNQYLLLGNMENSLVD